MRLKDLLWAVVFGMLVIGCSSSKKAMVTNPVLDTMMEQQKMEFIATSAHPTVTNAISQIAQSGLLAPGSTVGRIDLGGNSNFLKIDGDSVTANLAYYGERRLGGGYNSNSGIEFKGGAEDLEIVKDDVKNSYRLSFRVREQVETFNVTITLSSKLIGTLDIIGSHRTRIAYSGRANTLKESE